MRTRLPGFLLIVLLLIGWEIASATDLVDAVSLPRVSTILAAFVHGITSGTLPDAIGPSLWRIGAGFALACLVGIPLGLLMGTVPLVYRLLEPLTEFIRPIPSAAYIPVAILFLGIGDEMKIFVVFLASLFPILLNSFAGVRSIDPVLLDTARTFRTARLPTLLQIVLPAALPSILTGMRISVGLSLIVAVVAEMISGNSGIGYFILDNQRIFRVPEMFAGIFTLGLLGYMINLTFLRIEHHLLRWRANTGAG